MQREIPLDVTAAAKLELKIGDVVAITSAGVVSAVTDNSGGSGAAKAAVVEGNYIVAQSDMTMEYGHVPVENRDYKYKDDVVLNTTAKKAAFYRINNLEDVNLSERSVTTS